MEQQDTINQIEMARARWAEKLPQAIQQKEDEEAKLKEQEEERWRDQLRSISRFVPEWALEYVDRDEFSRDRDTGQSFFSLRLPGCSPISIVSGYGRVERLLVYKPRGVVFVDIADLWYPDAVRQEVDLDFDAAVATAHGYGASWQEAIIEAARCNEQELRPEPKSTPAPEPEPYVAAKSALAAARRAPMECPSVDAGIRVTLLAIVEQLNLINDTLCKMDR